MNTIKILHPVFWLILLFSSCKPDCDEYELTAEERIFITYNVGDKALFKNDVTGELDTMEIVSKYELPDNNPWECSKSKGIMEAVFNFKKIANGRIAISHNGGKGIVYDSGDYGFGFYDFQTLTVNNVTYYDVYFSTIDSNKIHSSHIDGIPWQIDFSHTRGFLRFHMRNNITWIKN